jgi:hypothetical protein
MPDTTVFWLIHLFLGVVLPIFVFTGCCRKEIEQEQAKAANKI